MVAGGSSFAQEQELGDYLSDILVLPPGESEWKLVDGLTLPYPNDYAASLVIDDKLICLSGWVSLLVCCC